MCTLDIAYAVNACRKAIGERGDDAASRAAIIHLETGLAPAVCVWRGVKAELHAIRRDKRSEPLASDTAAITRYTWLDDALSIMDDRQRIVAIALSEGKSIREVMSVASVGQQTVYNIMEEIAEIVAEYR